VSPVADFVPKLAGKSGGPVPRHIAVGPFVRVSTPEDCLNVRATPSTTGEILACYADGVLLPLRDAAVIADGNEWLGVRAPDGRECWAAARYLVPSTNR
jgi:SH3-like domain-containing protein